MTSAGAPLAKKLLAFLNVQHSILLAALITFFAAACISFAVQVIVAKKTLSPIGFLDHCFPLRNWRSKSARIDIVLSTCTHFTNNLIGLASFIIQVAGIAAVASALRFMLPVHAHFSPGLISEICLGIAFVVVVDFASYASHLIQHFVPVLWEFHKVHHSATFLSPLTKSRTHPIANLFDTTISSIVACLPMGAISYFFDLNLAHLTALVAIADAVGTVLVLDALKHSQFPVRLGVLDRLLMSPHAHQLHHSSNLEHWDKNFGDKLSVWDRMFKTMVTPQVGEELHYGLGDVEDHDYDTMLGVYLGPLVKAAKLCRGASASLAPTSLGTLRPGLIDRVFWRRPLPDQQTLPRA